MSNESTPALMLAEFYTPLGVKIRVHSDPTLGDGLHLSMANDSRRSEVYLSKSNVAVLRDLFNRELNEEVRDTIPEHRDVIELLKTVSVAFDVARLNSGAAITGGKGEAIRKFLEDVEKR